MSNISVIDPVGRAWDRMMLICFRPFNITKWFVLGFCAWLAYLGEGAGSFNFPGGGGGGGGGTGGGISVETQTPFEQAMAWMSEHALLIIVLTTVGVVVGLAIYLVIQWLRARGEFMFVNGIATNRSDDLISGPWKQFAKQANSFFIYQAATSIANILLALSIIGLCLMIAWPDLQAWQFGNSAIASILTFALVFPTIMILTGTVIACNSMFILPIMYVRGSYYPDAFREFWKKIVPGHMWTLTLFFTLYSLLIAAFWIVSVLAFCFTCCLSALPYIGTVVLLPGLVFLRSYSICYLEQFGSEYVMLTAEEPGRGFEVIMPANPTSPLPPPVPPAPPTPPAP